MGLRELTTKFLFGLQNRQKQSNDCLIQDGKVLSAEKVTPAAHQGGGVEQTKPVIATAPPLPPTTNDEAEELEQRAKSGRLPSLDGFWSYLEVSGRGKRTIEEYRLEWRWWQKKSVAVGKTPYTLRVKDIEASLKGLHPATVRRKVACLRSVGKWYLREGFPRLHTELGKFQSPRLPERLPRDRGAKEFLVLRERAKEFCTERKREGIWLGLMLMSGLRISEIATATSGDDNIRVIGKGQKERLVPAPSWVLDAMQAIPRDGKGGWVQGRKVIWKHLKNLGIRRPHGLRHTYASELLRRNKKIEEIRVLLGHARLDATSIYTHLTVPPDVVEVLEREP